jgi:hypothetical protein
MRIVSVALLGSCMLPGASHPATAADKIKIEIVEATTTIGLVPRTFPGTPEQIRTRCDTRVDVNCNSTVIPATEPSSELLPEVLSFELRAIFPDGSHVKLVCSPSSLNKKCGGIIPIAGSTPESVNCFLSAMASPTTWAASAAGATKDCTNRNLGIYRAKWEYDKLSLLIYEAGGKKEYRIAGSW